MLHIEEVWIGKNKLFLKVGFSSDGFSLRFQRKPLSLLIGFVYSVRHTVLLDGRLLLVCLTQDSSISIRRETTLFNMLAG